MATAPLKDAVGSCASTTVRCSGRTPSSGELPGAVSADADQRLSSAGQDDRGRLAVDGGDLHVDEVHARRADERGDELVGRRVVELERRADLRNAPLVENDDHVGERHRLDLIVSDVDHRRAEIGMQLGESRGAFARAASRRDWRAARRTEKPPACARAPGRSRPVGAVRRKAPPAAGRERARAAGCARLRACVPPGSFLARGRRRAKRRCSA